MSRSRRLLVAALAVVTGAVVAALFTLGGGGDGDAGAERTDSRPAAATPASPPSSRARSTTTARSPLGSGEPVTFAFGGDVHFEGLLRPQLLADPQGVLAPIVPELSSVDVAVVNLETAITERGSPAPKAYTFRAPASALFALAAAGVDVATEANNHGMDFGLEGLRDSIAASRASGLPVIGIGNDASEAYRPARIVVRGQRIAVIGATQVLDSNLIGAWTATERQPGLASAKDVERLVAEVQSARRTSDTVVVFLHWGIEKQTCPSGDQQALARRLVAAGADIVVGSHAHRLQGAGRMDGALVAYGLGNFVFYTTSGPGTDSGVLRVTATGRRIDSYEWRPAVIGNGVARPLTGDAAAAARAQWEALRACTGLAP